jgi:Flp pilus assembly protein TadD
MSSAAERLSLLQSYLSQDPRNAALLADACDTAIEAGLHAQALLHLEAGEGLGVEPAAWVWRRARLAIARRELEAAVTYLEQVESLVGAHAAVAHDRAYVRFLQGDFESCRALVAPWLSGVSAGEHRDALQSLWLRATHAAGLVREGWDWVASREKNELGLSARGVASLLAVDVGDFRAAKALADEALVGQYSHEGLVARGTVAIAERDAAGAVRWLSRALQRNADDGRTWSMLGIASLQAGQLDEARARLERATALMPQHIGTWHALTWTHLLQHRLDAARTAIERALALDANFAESHGTVGLVLALQGHAGAAERHLAIALRLDPGNVSGRYAKALLRGEVAEAEGLQAMVRKLLDRPGVLHGRLADDVLSAMAPEEGAG